MKTWMKIATGLLGGIAIIASLGGFGKKNQQTSPSQEHFPSDHIPDEILDGNLPEEYYQPRRGERIRRNTEQNMRGLQEGLTKASNVLGHISIICNSIVKMFYEDPCIRLSPTTYIV